MEFGSLSEIIVLSVVVLAFWIQQRKELECQQQLEEEDRREERIRIEGCRDVVRFFVNRHGYIARQVMSKEELETRIDGGEGSEELTVELARRIKAVAGIILGCQPVAGEAIIPVKVTQGYCDRHFYIVGKSG